MILFVALAMAVAQPSPAIVAGDRNTNSEIRPDKDPLSAKIDEAFALIKSGKPGEALPVLDEVIASEEARFRDERRAIYAARSMTEAILYAGLAASQKKSAIVLDDTWAMGYFMKGFALIDLNRANESKAWFDKALALAPMNSQFLSERGEWFKNQKDWVDAYQDFEAASEAAEFANEESKSNYQRRAWRGMAYARIEQGRVEEARELLLKCLKVEPTDDKCKREVEYIDSLKKPLN